MQTPTEYIAINGPKDKTITDLDHVRVFGKLLRNDIKKILVNGSEATINNDKSFALDCPLALGKNGINVVAVERIGQDPGRKEAKGFEARFLSEDGEFPATGPMTRWAGWRRWGSFPVIRTAGLQTEQ